MAVKLVTSNTFKTPVKFDLVDAAGKADPQSFVAEFKRLNREEIQTLLADMKNDVDGLKKILVGWDLKDEHGADVPYSPEAFEAFCLIPGAAGAAVLTYFEKVGAVRQKN